MATRYKGENTEMQRAFIFCLFTGIRWCDVKLLTYANVDPMTNTLRFQQKKVRDISSRSWVTTPLTDDMLALVGHSFAVNLLSNGANIKTVADLMGHSSITMTEKYLHVVDSLKQDAIHSLGSISYAMS